MASDSAEHVPQDASLQLGRRAAPRLRLAIPARFISTYSTQQCILLDISRKGARVALKEPVGEWRSGVVEFGKFELFGSIVRSDRGSEGGTNAIVFDAPITAGDVLAIRQFAESFETRERMALRDMVRRWVAGEP